MDVQLQGACRIRSTDDPAVQEWSAAVSVRPCPTHGARCREMALNPLPCEDVGLSVTLHDWVGDLEYLLGRSAVELPFSVGFDNFVAIFDSPHCLAQLKSLTASIAQMKPQQVSNHIIQPARFYGKDQSTLKAFPRQDEAFRFCDDHAELDLKVFSFESESMRGKRRFVAAQMPEFIRRYSLITPLERHVYEIIRDGYPCRAYLDLEFSKPENVDADGERMVSKVVHLLCWKLYELFGVSAGPSNVVDLDSSDDKKFSRHITLVIPYPSGELGSGIIGQDPEILFENNLLVGRLVASMIEDFFHQDLADNLSLCPPSVAELEDPEIDGTGLRLSAIAAAYRDLFVHTKDGRMTCFIDTGVYTRNRAFRLLSSCKYGKTAILRLSNNKMYNSRC